MKRVYTQKRWMFLLFFIITYTINTAAQNVGIGTNAPNASAKLHIEDANRGLLIPRISIPNLGAAAPVTTPATSLLVYNTNTTTGEGFHYWNGSQWVKLVDGIDHDWYEVGTTTAPNSINDNIFTQGRVGVGTTAPISKLHIRQVDPAGTESNALVLDGGNTAGANRGLQINWRTDAVGYLASIVGADDGSYDGRIEFRTSNDGGQTNTALTSADTRMVIKKDGRVGIGTLFPLGQLHVFEATGTGHSANTGTLVLEHDNTGGSSSIVFRSRANAGSDYGYINYSDDGSGNGSSNENGLLTIGVGNDGVGIHQDDIALMASGGVGIGTTAPDPATKLDVNGKVKIVDGTQSNGRVLASDANGVASWVDNIAITPTILKPTINTTNVINSTTAFQSTGLYIDLPPGRWIVFANVLLHASGSILDAGGAMWVRSTLSDTNTGTLASSGDIAGSSLISGGLIGPSEFAICSGQIIVNNSSGGTKRYYYVAGKINHFGTANSTNGFENLASGFWGEDQLFAVPIN